MPKQTLSICAYAACRHKAVRGSSRCEEHPYKRPPKKEHNPLYNRARWHRVRASQLRANPLCEMCGGIADTCHHIKEISDGGEPYDEDNLMSLCHSCHVGWHASHRKKTDQTNSPNERK